MNYVLMNKNIAVLKFSYDEETHTITKILELIHPDYAPLGIMEYKTGITMKIDIVYTLKNEVKNLLMKSIKESSIRKIMCLMN